MEKKIAEILNQKYKVKFENSNLVTGYYIVDMTTGRCSLWSTGIESIQEFIDLFRLRIENIDEFNRKCHEFVYELDKKREKYKKNLCVNCGVELRSHDEDGFCLDCFDEI